MQRRRRHGTARPSAPACSSRATARSPSRPARPDADRRRRHRRPDRLRRHRRQCRQRWRRQGRRRDAGADRRQHLHRRHDRHRRPDQLHIANNLGTGTITLDGGGLQWATGTTPTSPPGWRAIGAGGGTFDTNGNNVTLAAALRRARRPHQDRRRHADAVAATNSYPGGTASTAARWRCGGRQSRQRRRRPRLRRRHAAIRRELRLQRAITLNAGGGTFDTNGSTRP